MAWLGHNVLLSLCMFPVLGDVCRSAVLQAGVVGLHCRAGSHFPAWVPTQVRRGRINKWISARLQYLQYISTRNATGLHWTSQKWQNNSMICCKTAVCPVHQHQHWKYGGLALSHQNIVKIDSFTKMYSHFLSLSQERAISWAKEMVEVNHYIHVICGRCGGELNNSWFWPVLLAVNQH